MSKERTRDLEEDRHGKTGAVPFRRLLPLVVEGRWHLEIAATAR